MLVDSNVLIYAINADSPKHSLAKQFLKENSQNLHIAHQNIFETLRVLTHTKFSNPQNPRAALKSIFEISKSCQVIVPNNKTHYAAAELVIEHNLTGNRIFDAYLVATALTNDINVIATDNVKDLGKFSGMTIINPFKI